jgi:hypothetical protein
MSYVLILMSRQAKQKLIITSRCFVKAHAKFSLLYFSGQKQIINLNNNIMKRFSFFLMSVTLLLAMASCQKEQTINPSVPTDTIGVGTPDPGDSGNQLKATRTESAVSPKFGKPNSTYYLFKVYDLSGALPLSVKLYEKASGTTTYLAMTRSGSYWNLSVRISNNGWYDYRYVYSGSKANISSNSYTLCNTKSTFSSSGTSSITWPFGADGSSWVNRLGWIGAMEGGCGSGWNQGGHHYFSCGADDSYAEDWNKNCSTSYADDGAIFRSPLDGKVIKIFIDSPSNHNGGYGNAIDIQQETSDGRIYVFRIAHLKYAPPLSVGSYVRAGVTKIGNIGMTGGTSTAPHAHCALYNATNGCNTKAQFSFNAQ